MNKIYLLAFLLILGVGGSYAQKKIGIVDVQRVMDSLPSRRIAIAEIREIESQAEQEMQALDSLLAVWTSEKEAGTRTEEDVKQLQDRIIRRETDLGASFGQMASECEKNAREEVNRISLLVAKKMKLHGVYDKANFVFSKNAVDITEEVIAEILKTPKQ